MEFQLCLIHRCHKRAHTHTSVVICGLSAMWLYTHVGLALENPGVVHHLLPVVATFAATARATSRAATPPPRPPDVPALPDRGNTCYGIDPCFRIARLGQSILNCILCLTVCLSFHFFSFF